MMAKVLKVMNTAVIAAAAGTAAAVVIRDALREQRAQGARRGVPEAGTGEAGAGLRLRSIRVENYGPHAGAAEARIAPVTMVVGPNGAGKTRLFDALEALAGAVAGEIGREGDPFARVLCERAHRARGPGEGVGVGATWDLGAETLSVDVRAREDTQGRARIERWTMRRATQALEYAAGSEADTWTTRVDGEMAGTRARRWDDAAPWPSAPDWAHEGAQAIGRWSKGLRRIGRPRSETTRVGPDASGVAVLATKPEVGERVARWAEEAFGEKLVIRGSGPARRVRIGEGRAERALDARSESSAMLEAVPVAAAAASARRAGEGMDVIEHPEAGLDERAEGVTAALLLAGRARARTLVVESHGALTVLALRRAIARGEIAPEEAGIVYVEREGGARTVRSGGFDAEGEPEGWPQGLFTGEREAACALRRERGGASEGRGRESRAQDEAARALGGEEG